MLNACLYHSCQGPGMDPSVSCCAPKKADQSLSTPSQTSSLPQTPSLDPRPLDLENSTRTSILYTHVHNPLLTPVPTAHSHS